MAPGRFPPLAAKPHGTTKTFHGCFFSDCLLGHCCAYARGRRVIPSMGCGLRDSPWYYLDLVVRSFTALPLYAHSFSELLPGTGEQRAGRTQRPTYSPATKRGASPANAAKLPDPAGRPAVLKHSPAEHIAQRQERIDAFDHEESPPLDQPLEILCEGHLGTYVIPFLCQWSEGAPGKT